MMIVDLSVPLNGLTPVYPGDPAIKIEPAGQIDKDGFTDHVISLGTHIGTHIDAPMHMISGGATLAEQAIERFVGRGRLIRAYKEFSLDELKKADIRKGDIVLFDTGWSERYHEAVYFEEYPQIPEEVAQYLIDQDVNMIGIDMCSPDHEPFPIHKLFLSNGILIIENLTNLAQLEGREFSVYALPLKLEIDASPARVIAEIKE